MLTTLMQMEIDLMMKNVFILDKKLVYYLNDEKKDPSPLAVFRIGFGIMMAISIVRFWSYGWIELLYLNPKFHFKYYGFEWVKVYGNLTYLIFFIVFYFGRFCSNWIQI